MSWRPGAREPGSQLLEVLPELQFHGLPTAPGGSARLEARGTGLRVAPDPAEPREAATGALRAEKNEESPKNNKGIRKGKMRKINQGIKKRGGHEENGSGHVLVPRVGASTFPKKGTFKQGPLKDPPEYHAGSCRNLRSS